MKRVIRTYCIIMLFVFAAACKKNSNNPAPPGPTAKCLLATESANIPGYFTEGRYEYNADKKPVIIRWFHSSGVELKYKEIVYAGPSAVVETNLYNGANKVTIKYFHGNGAALPLTAERYLNDGNNFYLGGYDFHYDVKNRLEKVVQGTPQPGDVEYTLFITYNADDNVTRLEYERTSGPRTPNTVITVAAYDDKPSPFAANPNHKFTMDAVWDNSDPIYVITALSKNNPLDYTFNTLLRKMTYTYNEHGFPLVRTNTNITPAGQVTYIDNFSYNCN